MDEGNKPDLVGQIAREVLHVRELSEERWRQSEIRYRERFEEQNLAVMAAREAAQRAIDAMKSTIQEQLRALDDLTSSRFVTHRTLMDTSSEKVALALSAADKAVTKAEIATEKRFEAVDEFRGALHEQSKTFVTRVEFDALSHRMTEKIDGGTNRTMEKIDDLRKSRDMFTGTATGASALWGYAIGGVGLLGTVVTVAIVLLKASN